MFINNIRNKRMLKEYSKNAISYAADGSYVENTLFEAKDKNVFVIHHIQYADDGGNLTFFGNYKILNNKHERIGYLKYVFINTTPSHMKLGDIYFEYPYRNLGIGSMVLALFEQRAYNYGAQYIEGELSFVDEEDEANKLLRNAFYKKAGYNIVHNKIYKRLTPR